MAFSWSVLIAGWQLLLSALKKKRYKHAGLQSAGEWVCKLSPVGNLNLTSQKWEPLFPSPREREALNISSPFEADPITYFIFFHRQHRECNCLIQCGESYQIAKHPQIRHHDCDASFVIPSYRGWEMIPLQRATEQAPKLEWLSECILYTDPPTNSYKKRLPSFS